MGMAMARPLEDFIQAPGVSSLFWAWPIDHGL